MKYDVEDMMKAYAEDAVNLGKELGINLDYSEESIEYIEEILEMHYDSLPRRFIGRIFKKTSLEEEIIKAAKMYGGYIGEVIRKNIGGTWSFEERTIILNKGNTYVFPPTKVYNRIINGQQENLWDYYQTLKNDLKH